MLLSLAVSIAFAVAQASASTPGSTRLGTKTPDAAPQSHPFKSTPAAPSATAPANPSHLFTVNDVKGLLLTCVAPEIESNPDTDVFKSCSLAPGRTLDDAMHTFVQGIHYEQSQHEKEREEWQKTLAEKTAQKPAPTQ
jgi:hypothetical protein